MTIHKLPIVGGIIGIAVSACSVIRWFFMFPDPSQMILGAAAGATICGFSYVYNWMRENDVERLKINKRLDSFTEWWTRQEMQ